MSSYLKKTCCLLSALSMLMTAASAFAADVLRIEPKQHDCGVVDEGVPATMTAVVENVSGKDVHVSSVKTN
ncbi:hypothetical protein F6V30_15185 [Oryzomonas sagensis]|uniref:Uncharacterized protein n=1 Tax=Oryzomonas sagensis TaxID=2603857 RepID=A0ABQ6TL62_9BACT|nr:hypothetical protein [Oryzomonas sagensis]KAB0668845.1 hypothetical protein F6V30_15185 [Oryzomonas sagensis]